MDVSYLELVSGIRPMEPTTSSLGRYGEYPMDLSNGLPDISIVLYEIKSGDLTVPIFLRYQGGGIKVWQESSWVGLGWDLFFGGQVTRTVHGMPDENEPAFSERPTHQEITQYINQHTIEHDLYLYNLATINTSQPDEYFYNIGMESGKFIGKDVEAIIPHKPVNINWNKNIIVNSKGEVFIFTANEKTKIPHERYPEYTTAWYVSSITSPNNHKITYTYQSDGTYYPASYNAAGCYQGYTLKRAENNDPKYNFYAPISLTINSMKPKVTCYKPEYINFNGGRLKFELGNRTDIGNTAGFNPIKKLDRIVVQRLKTDNTYETVKYIYFDYYYKNNRLILNKVYENTPGENKTIVVFEYDTTNLPAKNSYSYDYCGYFNNSSNITPIPFHTISAAPSGPTNIGGANKKVSESASKAGVLTGIEYPTKGKTVFNWENHRYAADKSLLASQYVNEKTVHLSYDDSPECTFSHTNNFPTFCDNHQTTYNNGRKN